MLHGVRAAVKGDDLRIGDALERLLEHGRRGQCRKELGCPVADTGAHAAAAVDEQVKRRLALGRRCFAAKNVLGIERDLPQLALRERAGALAGAAFALLAQEFVEPVVQRLCPLGKCGRQPPATRRDIRLRKRQTGIPLGQPLPLPGVEPGSTRAGDMQLLLERPLACERFFRRGEHGVRLGRAERKAAVHAPARAEHFAQALRPAGGRLLRSRHRVRRGGGRPALAVIAAAADAGRSAAVLPAVGPG